MPTYTYSCPSCGKFDIFQTMKEDTLQQCPTCEEPINKVFSAPSIAGFANVPSTANPTYRPDRSALWNSAQIE